MNTQETGERPGCPWGRDSASSQKRGVSGQPEPYSTDPELGPLDMVAMQVPVLSSTSSCYKIAFGGTRNEVQTSLSPLLF